MPRTGNHRSIYRTGMHHSRPQRRTYLRTKVCRHINASDLMFAHMQCLGGGLYRMRPADVAACRMALDDARPYAKDETGELWP